MGEDIKGRETQPDRTTPLSLIERSKKPLGLLLGVLAAVSSIITILGFFGIDRDSFRFNSIPLLSMISALAFIGAALCIVFWRPTKPKNSASLRKPSIVTFVILVILGILAIIASLVPVNIPPDSASDTRTLIGSIEPAPENFQIQRDGATATVRGVEMQAKTCPMESTSFDITSLEPDDRVTFSLEGFPGDNNPGTYAITIRGAGLSENYRLTPGSLQRIEFNARESGNVEVSISAQHRPDRGSSCDSTNEVLAIENTVLN